MGITAKELAKKLNLSAAAVSMALNNKPGVSTKTRQLVFDTAEKYGYDFGRITEKQSVPGTIYFVIYKKHGTIVGDTPFFSQVSDGVSLGCKNANYKLKSIYIYEDDDTLKKQIEDIQYSDCCGIILLGTEMTAEDLKLFVTLPIPFVLLDAYFETVPCDCVLINNEQGAYLATRYLIQKCKKQPGYLKSSFQISNFSDRASGFYKAIRSSGFSSSKSIVHALSPSVDGAYSDMLELIRNKEELAECYFADNDHIAIGAVKALKENGFRIPEDISIVGFDNLPSSTVIEPSLTTIQVPKQYMGELAVERLIKLLAEPGLSPVKTEVSTSLIKRNSVCR
ncbi:LacI family DNA-binding transcriptional regulator [Konateibacter massiliensis]|uniref:LacI family DNA-binding transcriptional regulator n=1 Tax=Konateibacter massiliensis TaxID=2002841 RepID=UPI000C15F494|nr:LacI family DNA-binding transcriptional regulator [Konateibacter massiliensis]